MMWNVVSWSGTREDDDDGSCLTMDLDGKSHESSFMEKAHEGIIERESGKRRRNKGKKRERKVMFALRIGEKANIFDSLKKRVKGTSFANVFITFFTPQRL